MKELIDYFSQFGYLNQQHTALISEKATTMKLRKDEYFAEAGKISTQVGFIVEGVFRICYYNNKGQDITRYFMDENHLLLNPYYNEPYTEYVQAATGCKLLVFSGEDWKQFSEIIAGWDDIVQKIRTKHLTDKLRRRSPLIEQDATTRYLMFLENFPTLVNRIPLSYIASYLGITQSSLSRIRKNIR